MASRGSRSKGSGRCGSIWIGAGIGALVGIAAAISIGLAVRSGDSGRGPMTGGAITNTTAGTTSAAGAPTIPTAPTARTPTAAVPRPPIVRKLITFGADRRDQMTEYSRKHYGPKWAGWQLIDPKVIVEHYTASDTMSSAWNTFESNSPDGELGQLPGTCAHFIVDKDGTIYQLVTLDTRCRHTVGLNHRSIGIEMVGMSDRGILSNPLQIKAALALTRWLQAKFDIPTPDVIGHSESVSSPYHLELYGPWKTQTHGDWSASAMREFRSRIVTG